VYAELCKAAAAWDFFFFDLSKQVCHFSRKEQEIKTQDLSMILYKMILLETYQMALQK